MILMLGTYSWWKPAMVAYPCLSFKALMKSQKLLAPDPWDHSQWLHRVPRGPVSRAGAESRTSVAAPPEAFAGSVLDLSRPCVGTQKCDLLEASSSTMTVSWVCSRSHSNFLATSCQTMSNQHLRSCHSCWAGCFLLLGSGSGWHPKSAGPNPI